MIVIIDYGLGNLSSIANMFRRIGTESTISSDVEIISKAEKLVLPGVGAFDEGMKRLEENNFLEILNQKIIVDKTPILGICLGMQLFTKESEEGSLKGLGWLDAETKRFNFGDNLNCLKVPHMGWNIVNPQNNSSLFKDNAEELRYYFVHSYHVVCENNADILATSNYGYDFVAAVEKENIYGVQFHPEKSHKFGMKLLKNFAEPTC